MSIHNNLKTIKEEMKKQFDEIISSIYSYHDQMEGVDTSILTKKNYKIKEHYNKEAELSSSEEESDSHIKKDKDKSEQNLLDNHNDKNKKELGENSSIQNKKSKDKKADPYYFLSNNIEDFHDDNYNFERRTSLPHKIVCPQNIIN